MRSKINKLKLEFRKAIFLDNIRVSSQKKTMQFFFEEKLNEYGNFYKRNNIDTSLNFRNSVRKIWGNNIELIKQVIEKRGFDEILIIPEIKDIVVLHEKMTMGYNPTFQGDNFRIGGSFAGAQSQNMDQPHLVLVHKAQNLKDYSELSQTFNIKGQDVKQEEALTLEEYLIFQRKYYEETRKHIDEDTWTWLSTKLNTRLVGAGWHQTRGELRVNAGSYGTHREDLGVRSSCRFF